VCLEDLAHRQLSGSRQIHELAEAIQKELAAGSAQLLMQQQTLDVKFLFRILERLPHLRQRHTVFGAQRPQYVGLDQIRERQQRRVVAGRLQNAPELTRPLCGRIRAADEPRAQRCRRHAQIPGGLRNRIRGCMQDFVLRGEAPLGIVPQLDRSGR
jgi:hypothetical protein